MNGAGQNFSQPAPHGRQGTCMGPGAAPVAAPQCSMTRPHCLVGGVLFFLAVASSSAQYVHWHRHDAGQAAEHGLFRSKLLPGTDDAGLLLMREKAGVPAYQAAQAHFQAQEEAIRGNIGQYGDQT